MQEHPPQVRGPCLRNEAGAPFSGITGKSPFNEHLLDARPVLAIWPTFLLKQAPDICIVTVSISQMRKLRLTETCPGSHRQGEALRLTPKAQPHCLPLVMTMGPKLPSPGAPCIFSGFTSSSIKRVSEKPIPQPDQRPAPTGILRTVEIIIR